MDIGASADGNSEESSRGGALEIALSVDSEGVKEHAQWWNPELKSLVDAHLSSAGVARQGAGSGVIPGGRGAAC